MAAPIRKRIESNNLNLKEQVVSINRVTKVVKGGKNLSFSALVVVGDPSAKIVGFGTGKAKEVPAAIKKGIEAAKKNLRRINTVNTTILHPVVGVFGAGRVLLKPAKEGTGVIAGGPVRAVIQAVGIANVLTKSLGSHNPHNVVKATIDALEQLRDKAQVAELRGLKAAEQIP
jgi:small subunit ribosomal protein S5